MWRGFQLQIRISCSIVICQWLQLIEKGRIFLYSVRRLAFHFFAYNFTSLNIFIFIFTVHQQCLSIEMTIKLMTLRWMSTITSRYIYRLKYAHRTNSAVSCKYLKEAQKEEEHQKWVKRWWRRKKIKQFINLSIICQFFHQIAKTFNKKNRQQVHNNFRPFIDDVVLFTKIEKISQRKKTWAVHEIEEKRERRLHIDQKNQVTRITRCVISLTYMSWRNSITHINSKEEAKDEIIVIWKEILLFFWQ